MLSKVITIFAFEERWETIVRLNPNPAWVKSSQANALKSFTCSTSQVLKEHQQLEYTYKDRRQIEYLQLHFYMSWKWRILLLVVF